MRPIAVSVAVLGAAQAPVSGHSPDAAPKTPLNVTVPNVANMIMMATDSPKSPTRLTTNAFLAAAA
jgi:hypothetical protein